jgi:hypothetical protein
MVSTPANQNMDSTIRIAALGAKNFLKLIK